MLRLIYLIQINIRESVLLCKEPTLQESICIRIKSQKSRFLVYLRKTCCRKYNLSQGCELYETDYIYARINSEKVSEILSY
jgi:hypothetical protein